MKRVLKWTGLGLLGVVVGLLVGGLLIDPRIELQTKATIEAKPAVLFELVSTPAGIQRWWKDAGLEPGHEAAARMTVVATSGTQVQFKSGESTAETWTRRGLESGRWVLWEVDFAGMFTVQRTLSVKPGKDGASVVTWKETGRLGNPFMRWMKVLMPPESIIENFDAALKLLDKRAREENTR